MRPPAKQAENGGGQILRRKNLDAASMRPPAKQAENSPSPRAPPSPSSGFNEAACKTGGKPSTTASRRIRGVTLQ